MIRASLGDLFHRRHQPRLAAHLVVLSLLALALTVPKPVYPQALGVPAAPSTAEASQPEPGFDTRLSTRSNLLGDIGGLRTFLGRYGVTIELQGTSELLGNVTGGTHTGFAYDGSTLMGVGIDTQKAFGLEGGTFNISARRADWKAKRI